MNPAAVIGSLMAAYLAGSITFVPTGTIGIGQQDGGEGIPRIYPNPARGSTVLQIRLESPKSLEMFMFDAMGRLVRQHDYGKLPAGLNRMKVDLRGLPDGTYHFQLRMDGVSRDVKALVVAD